MSKSSVLVLLHYYIPSFKSGGPVRSISNLVNTLAEDLQFRILTADRDLGDEKRYVGIEDGWVQVGNAEVKYLNKKDIRKFLLSKKFIEESQLGVIYVNSIFDFDFSILPLLVVRFFGERRQRIVVAPRGELLDGAFNNKKLKKSLYLLLARALRLFNSVVWHATSEDERDSIIRKIGAKKSIVVASNIPVDPGLAHMSRRRKTKGELRVIFLSRISRKKNLLLAIKVLNALNLNREENVIFDIYGPVFDDEYWNSCKQEMQNTGTSITVNYIGSIEYEFVGRVLADYDLFFLPTLGENFGHAIFEALSCGTPVMISNKTPFQDIEEKKAGWIRDPEDLSGFLEILYQCLNMNALQYEDYIEGAMSYAKEWFKENSHKSLYRDLFRA